MDCVWNGTPFTVRFIATKRRPSSGSNWKVIVYITCRLHQSWTPPPVLVSLEARRYEVEVTQLGPLDAQRHYVCFSKYHYLI
jgi:hypothetical protein